MIEPVRKEKVQQTLTRCWALTSLARRFPYVFEEAEGVDIARKSVAVGNWRFTLTSTPSLGGMVLVCVQHRTWNFVNNLPEYLSYSPAPADMDELLSAADRGLAELFAYIQDGLRRAWQGQEETVERAELWLAEQVLAGKDTEGLGETPKDTLPYTPDRRFYRFYKMDAVLTRAAKLSNSMALNEARDFIREVDAKYSDAKYRGDRNEICRLAAVEVDGIEFSLELIKPGPVNLTYLGGNRKEGLVYSLLTMANTLRRATLSPAERGRLFFFALATLEAIRKLRAKVIYGKECV